MLLPVNTAFFLPCWVIALGLHLRQERPRLAHSGMKGLAGITVGLLLVTALSYRVETSLGGLFNYLPFFLFFWLITRLVDSPKRVGQLLVWSLVGVVLTGTAGVFEWVSGVNWQWKILGPLEVTIGSQAAEGILDRVTAFFFWPTSAAAYFLLVVPVAIALAVSAQDFKLRLAAGWGGLTTFIALIGTASRNAWGAIALALVLLLAYARRWLILSGLALALAAIVTAALGPVTWPVVAPLRQVVPTFLWQKLANTFDPQVHAYESTSERVESWAIAGQMILTRPLTGWGPQTFPFVGVDVYHKKALTSHAHNLYLTYGAELGLPLGLGLLAFMGYALLSAALALPYLPAEARWWTVGLLGGLLAYLFFGFFDVAFYEARVNGQLWLWLALCWQIPVLFPPKK